MCVYACGACILHGCIQLLLFAVFGNPKLCINVGIYLSFMPTPGKGSAAEVMLQASAIGFLGSPASKVAFGVLQCNVIVVMQLLGM